MRRTRFALFLLFIFVRLLAQDDPEPNRFLKSFIVDNTSIALFKLWDKKNTPPSDPIVFVGSSSIRKWETANYFPELPIVNRGFGGAHISDVNYFINETVLKYGPKVIVFYAGDNDINYGKTPKNVFLDYCSFVDNVHLTYPKTKIIFISIKPSISRWALWPKMRDTNNLINQFSKNHSLLYYVDVASPMIGDDGLPGPNLFVNDGLHLSKKGYDLWSNYLDNILRSQYSKSTKDEGFLGIIKNIID
tara:strand:+ start:59 stop:799 length:741 start_codon:yes stop_codon:yes gene_type:complete